MANQEPRPSVKETAFACPHCGAYTTQHWNELYTNEIGENHRIPFLPDQSTRMQIDADPKLETDKKANLLALVDEVLHGLVSVIHEDDTEYLHDKLLNLFLSKCYNCGKYAVWLGDRLLFPGELEGPHPIAEMPDGIRSDFNEARSILNASPRGAAALLRLAIQKLCIHLGEKTGSLDNAIRSLVARGLNPTVQKSLDIVRVVGNEAVHPGVLDLKDDRETAVTLLDLVNLIVEQMISNPAKVEHMYSKLPKDKRKAIEKRDG
jgi:hypothetical protein